MMSFNVTSIIARFSVLLTLMAALFMMASTAFAQDDLLQSVEVATADDNVVLFDEYFDVQDRPGFMISGAAGSGGLIGFGAQFSVGYSFNRFFALSLDWGGNIALLSASTDITIVPKLQIPYRSFRFSLGLGLGYSYAQMGFVMGDSCYLSGFVAKPQLLFDWFINHNWFLGISAEIPVLIANEITPIGYELEEKRRTTVEGVYLMFHFGYKF